jgi:heme/copper-type cytochrome/quinol oxidase subunit 2
MSVNLLLSTIILVSFLVTIVMAVGSYVAYKLREARRPRIEIPAAEGESPYFERILADDR